MATSKGLLKLTIDAFGDYKLDVKIARGITDVIQRPNHKNEYYALAFDSDKNHMYFYKSIDYGETWIRAGDNGKGWYEPTGKMANSWGEEG